MKDTLLTLLRDKSTSTENFRRAADHMGMMLSFEVANFLEKELLSIETPLAPAVGTRFKNRIVLIPILRAGIALLTPFMKLFPDSRVGFVGLKRDEETAVATLYYKNIPPIEEQDVVIILDPMIATGGSGSTVIDLLKSLKVPEERIYYVGIIAAPEGLNYLRKLAPDMKILAAEVDERLNDKKFIVPGLGDFGDRYFGT